MGEFCWVFKAPRQQHRELGAGIQKGKKGERKTVKANASFTRPCQFNHLKDNTLQFVISRGN